MTIFVCDLLITGSCKKFLESERTVATCGYVPSRPTRNGTLAMVYLQWFTCNGI